MRTWELSKAGQRLTPNAYRSGCYQRALAVLQDETGDSGYRTSAANSLQQAVTRAYAKHCAGCESLQQTEDRDAPQQRPDPDQTNHTQEKLAAKLDKQQQRRKQQQQRHEHSKKLSKQRHEHKVKLRQAEFAAQMKQQRQRQSESMQQLERRKQELEQQLQQHKQDSAAITQAEQDAMRDLLAAPQEKLTKVQEQKAAAEAQLAQATQAGEHMSRRAASIEPEDGECTPSPSALQQPSNATQVVQQVAAMQALPPPPPVANPHVEGRHQSKEGNGTSDKAAYSARHFSDSSLPPPPPVR